MGDPVEPKDILTCLIGARRSIVEVGWLQGQYGGRAGGYCMVGAIYNAASQIGLGVTSSLVERSIAELMPHTHEVASAPRAPERQARGAGWITHWNDSPERTKEQVISVFDRSIEALKGSTKA